MNMYVWMDMYLCTYISTYMYMYLIYFAFLIQITSCHLHVSPLFSIFNVHFLPPKNRPYPSCKWSLSGEWGGVASQEEEGGGEVEEDSVELCGPHIHHAEDVSLLGKWRLQKRTRVLSVPKLMLLCKSSLGRCCQSDEVYGPKAMLQLWISWPGQPVILISGVT